MGLISSIFDHFSDKAERQDQQAYDAYLKQEERDYNEKITQQDRAWQLYLWNLQNEYNSPANQRKRLEAAGINPVLAFGSQASSMAAPIGSPVTGRSTSNEGRMQRYFEKATQLASIASMRENTRREKNNNDLFEYLLEDKKKHDLLKLRSDLVEFEWNLQHKADYMNEELEFKRQQRRLKGLEADIAIARKNQEWVKYDMLMREKQHLISKYGFEDAYYNLHLNPYETSTIAGGIRTAAGLVGTGVKALFDNPIAKHDWYYTKKLFQKEKKDLQFFYNHAFDRF